MLWLLVCLFQAAAGCYAESAEEILAKVAQTYSKADSLKLELKTNYTKSSVNRRAYETTQNENVRARKFTVSLALERPDKLRLRIRGIRFEELLRYGGLISSEEREWKTLDFKKFDYLAVSDGQTVWACVLDQPRQCTIRPVDKSHSGDLHPTMEFLIGRDRNLTHAGSTRIVKHDHLNRDGTPQ